MHALLSPPMSVPAAVIVQSTQVWVASSHAGVAPVQADLSVEVHCPQAPVGRHTGPALPAPPQSASLRHAMQSPREVSHTGVMPVQSEWFEIEHWPQVPPGWHTGPALPGPLQSVSLRQGPQVPLLR
jgi:hypothetical protein